MRFEAVEVAGRVDVWASGYHRESVPAAKVVDTESGIMIPIRYTASQAEFLARYLNDVETGVIKLR